MFDASFIHDQCFHHHILHTNIYCIKTMTKTPKKDSERERERDLEREKEINKIEIDAHLFVK